MGCLELSWAALWQTNPRNENDGEWYINKDEGLGVRRSYGGEVPDGVWHRLALVVDTAADALISFVNGARVQQLNLSEYAGTVRGEFAAGPTGLLFADENLENAAGFVNSVQMRDVPLTALRIALLGGPSAEGIRLPGR